MGMAVDQANVTTITKIKQENETLKQENDKLIQENEELIEQIKSCLNVIEEYGETVSGLTKSLCEVINKAYYKNSY